MPDLWGAAALNLGVLLQRCGDYDRARELFAEALGLFATVKQSEYQLGALYNPRVSSGTWPVGVPRRSCMTRRPRWPSELAVGHRNWASGRRGVMSAGAWSS
jgi:hypothetical protein